MKTSSRIIFTILLMLLRAVGQTARPAESAQAADVKTQGAPKPWCEKDNRSEIANYCNDLFDFQQKVTANAAAISAQLTDASTNPANLAVDLNQIDILVAGAFAKLDLIDPKSMPKFITVMGPVVAADAATAAATSDALSAAGQQRPDRQMGANSTASGTTSLVSKPGSAELLSLALDTGAVTQSVNGTSSTLTTNADQVFRLVTGSNPDCTVAVGPCKSRGWFETWVLNPTNITATLGLAQQSSTVTPTSGQASGTSSESVSSAAIPTGAGKLSGLTVRYEVRNHFDPRSDAFKKAWSTAVSKIAPSAKAVGDDTDAVKNILNKLPASNNNQAKQTLVVAALQDSSGKALTEAFDAYFSNFKTQAMNDSTLGPAISKVMQDRAVYRGAWFQALDAAVGTLFTLEYDYNRPVNQPFTHDLKLIYGYDFGEAGMLNFNGAVSIYSTIPAGAKYGSLHYGQVSTEYDRTLTGQKKSIQTQLSLAGYWQYQPHPSILNIPAGTVAPGTDIPLPNGTQEFVGTAGSLWVTQAKLTIKGSGGINIPIGVSWSNKTDLLEGSKVGAQVGISYNFSSLAGLFTGGSSQ
jgi:hypothetical protein